MSLHIKRMVYTATFIALGVLFPMAFHAFGSMAGPVLLPMHIPVILCGLVCGWYFGAICGALAPLLSSLMTGMPPLGILPAMLCELTVYGAVSGLLFHFVRTKKVLADLYISLAGAMLVGRCVLGVLNALFFSAAGTYSFKVWGTAAFVTSLPGIIIQLLLIPSLVITLEKINVLPKNRYEKADPAGTPPEDAGPPLESVDVSDAG